MKFGIAVPTDADSWRLVRRAEELGFSNAWFYDTQMLSADCFVAMAAAAVKTTRIRLGTGVLIPSNRIAPVAANAFASLTPTVGRSSGFCRTRLPCLKARHTRNGSSARPGPASLSPVWNSRGQVRSR